MIVNLITTVYNFLWGDLFTIPLPGGGSLGISLLILLLIPTGIYFTIRTSGSCAGLSFVITGDVHHYKNRDEFKAYVESQGGKVTGSVSKKTAYLVNNDVESASSKNRKAKELGIPIISEDTFIEQFGGR